MNSLVYVLLKRNYEGYGILGVFDTIQIAENYKDICIDNCISEMSKDDSNLYRLYENSVKSNYFIKRIALNRLYIKGVINE